MTEAEHDVRPWWESRLCIVLVVLATMVPLLYPPIPPLVDLFGHMGRYRVELDLHHSTWLQRYYNYHWAAIGNLGVDLLIIPFGKLFGLEPAVKLIVLAIPPLTAIGFLWVAREVHGRIPPTAFFALPFIYGYPFLFGFVNFALSVAFAFLAFGLWLRLGRLERTTLREWLFVPISIVVFFTHTYGWGLLGLLCFSADAVRLHDRGRTWWRAGIEAALRTSVMALPILIMLVWRSEAHGGHTTSWFEWKIKWHWIYSALRDRWKWFDIGSLAAATLVFLYAIANRIFGRTLSLSRNLAFSAIVLAISRVITITGMTCSEYWPLLRNSHLGAMVIVRREGFSNDQWLMEGLNLLDLKYTAAGYFAADPSQLVRPNNCRDPLHRTIDESLAALPRNDFDYVWLIDVPPYDPGLVASIQLVWRGPGSVLYRLH